MEPPLSPVFKYTAQAAQTPNSTRQVQFFRQRAHARSPSANVNTKTLDEKSQWIERLLKDSKDTADLTTLADNWQIRKHIWQKFWDRLFEQEVRFINLTCSACKALGKNVGIHMRCVVLCCGMELCVRVVVVVMVW